MVLISFRNAFQTIILRISCSILLLNFFAVSTSGNNNNNNEESSSRKGKGRRKVTMAKMENESNLQVTFSKRRNGLFKKASELSTRCGSETALVVFSPADKPYSFGHPSIETVATRFLGENDPTAGQSVAHATERQMMADSSAKLTEAIDQLDLAKNQAKELDQLIKHVTKLALLKDMNFQQLNHLKGEVLDFKNKFENRRRNDQIFTVPNPNLGTYPRGSTFDLPFSSIFGHNVPVASYDPPFAGSSSTTNFPASFDYSKLWNIASSSFLNPFSPPTTTADPTVTIPEWNNSREDGDE